MRYITYSPDRGWLMDDYFSYLKLNRTKFPDGVFEFAYNSCHYDLSDSSSLHDAWLDYFVLRENAAGDRKQFRSLSLELQFLGPFHDKVLQFDYLDVSDFSMRTKDGAPALMNGCGDVLMHEVRLSNEGLVEHEFQFSTSVVLAVTCSTFRFESVSIN